MRWLIPLFLLFASAAFTLSPTAETRETFNLKQYGVDAYDTPEFYPPSEIERAVEENKVQCSGTADYIHRAGFSILETALLGPVPGRSAAKILGKQISKKIPAAEKLLGKKIGLKPRASETYPLRDKIEKAFASALKKGPELRIGIYALLLDRPCPGGLKLAAKQALTIALADYTYALSHNVSCSGKEMAAAQADIKDALEKYKGYDGFLDAEFLMFTNLSPQGFYGIIDRTTSAVEHLERAIKYGERYKTEEYEVSLR